MIAKTLTYVSDIILTCYIVFYVVSLPFYSFTFVITRTCSWCLLHIWCLHLELTLYYRYYWYVWKKKGERKKRENCLHNDYGCTHWFLLLLLLLATKYVHKCLCGSKKIVWMLMCKLKFEEHLEVITHESFFLTLCGLHRKGMNIEQFQGI